MKASGYILAHLFVLAVACICGGASYSTIVVLTVSWLCLFCRVVHAQGHRILVRTKGSSVKKLMEDRCILIWPQFLESDPQHFGMWRFQAQLPQVGQVLKLKIPDVYLKVKQGEFLLRVHFQVMGVVENYGVQEVSASLSLEEQIQTTFSRTLRREIRSKSLEESIATIERVLTASQAHRLLHMNVFQVKQVISEEGMVSPGDEKTKLAMQNFGRSSFDVPKREKMWKVAPLPENEQRRLECLRKAAIMHTEAECRYDSITSVVAGVMNVPICLISLVAEDKQWFKSKCGLAASSTPRSYSFCAFTLLPEDVTSAEMFVVEDALLDERVAENPLVTGDPFIRFYGGCPLVGAEGLRYGALCAIDRAPKRLTAIEAQVLVNFAQLAVQEIERQELLKIDVGAEQPMCPGLPSAPMNFQAGPLRAWRMRKGLTEAVILVWAPEGSSEWLILYGNEIWLQITGFRVDPTPKFPVSNISVKGQTCSNVLKDILQFEGGFSSVVEQSGHALHPFSTTATLETEALGASQKSTLRVSCRFNPGALPLDASAAVIRPDPVGTEEELSEKFVSSLDGTRGQLYFVTIVEETFSKPSASKASAQATPGASEALPQELGCLDAEGTRLVGEGTFGKVYFSLWGGSQVAVKGTEMKDGEKIRNLDLLHPNLASIFTHVSRKVGAKTEAWIIEEWCDGGTFTDHCCWPRRTTEEGLQEVFEMCWEIAQAIQYIHSRGVIHGSLSGNSVMRKVNHTFVGYSCKVSCDFGVLLNRPIDMSSKRRCLFYMPPERFTSPGEAVTMKADVWSLGVLFWQALTGELPFKDLAVEDVAAQIVKGKRLVLPSNVDTLTRYIFEECTTDIPRNRPAVSKIVCVLAEMAKSGTSKRRTKLGTG